MSNNGNEMLAGAGVLKQGAQMAVDAKADLDTIAKNLHGQLTAVQAKWQGGGGGAFQKLQMDWNQKQGVIVAQLHDFEASLLQTDRINVTNDDQQTSNMTQLANKLGSV